MKRKKIVALFCAGLMVLSTAACGVGETGTEKTGTTGGSESTGEPGSTGTCQDAGCVWDPNTPYEETITFTKGIETKSGDKFSEGDNYENNVFTRYMEDTVNVKMESAWEVDTNNFDQKTALCIAGGEKIGIAHV